MKPTLKPLAAAIILATSGTALATTQAINSHQPSTASMRQAIEDNKLILATGAFDPTAERLNFSAMGLSDTASDRYGIVQFNQGHASADWLKSRGFKVLNYLPANAYLVNWQGVDRSVLGQNSDIRWHGPFQSGFKISPSLWSVNRPALSHFDVTIQAFSDYPRAHLRALIQKMTPSVQFIQSNIPQEDNRLAVRLPAQNLDAALSQLASAEGIQWINLYYPERLMNQNAVPAIQDTSANLNDQTLFDKGLYGSGQIVAVADSGLDRNEDWFVHLDKGAGVSTALTDAQNTAPPLVGTVYPNNKVLAYWVMPGATSYDHAWAGYHGTHVSGSVAGDKQVGGSVSNPNQSGYDTDDGMAPNAQILFQDLGGNSGLSGIGSSPMWQQAYEAGARIHSNSYGASTYGEYISSDANLDRSLRDLDDMIIVMAAGNDDGTNNSTSSPGNAKNALTVGALGHGNSSSVAGFSNRGLTDDGRLKPDISTTGSSITSASGDSNNNNTIDNPSTKNMSGTSMATPITAGGLALLRQYFTDGFYPTGVKNSADVLIPSGQLMKAMILNGTNVDAGFNYRHTGWGRPWLANTLYFNGDSRRIKFWDVTHENGLKTGESMTFNVDVLSGQEFRATLTWYDLAGPTGSGVTLVNDLNLTVAAPNGTYLGNVMNSGISAESQMGGSADSINTVEQVRITAPQSGTYQLTVSGGNIPGDGSFGTNRQGFALAVGGDLGSLTPQPLGNPGSLTATDQGLSGVDLNWAAASHADYYELYRANGTCLSIEPGSMRYLGQSATNSYTDLSTVGGYNYAYQVRAFNSDYESALSNCVDVSSTQICDIPPQFNGGQVALNNQANNTCGLTMTWPAASSHCPADPDIQYKIYRDIQHNFIANGSTLLTTVPSGTQFTDFSVVDGQPYYYRIKAVNGSNESDLSTELAGTAFGQPSAVVGTINDDVDNSLLMNLSGTWSVSNERSFNGNLSYRSTFEGANTYTSNTCARMHSPLISVPNAGSPSIDYRAWYEIEANWDGVVVEISTDGGNSWQDLPPVGGYPSNFSSTQNPPINGCGYPTTQGAFGGASSGFDPVSHDLSAYAGQNVQIRWSMSTDPGYEEEGFYIDDIQYNNVHTPNTCSALVDLIFKDGFE
ncbi:MAG: S8 family serine peptidase [Marinicella pacifica]